MADVYLKKDVGIVDVDLKDLAAHQNLGSDDPSYLRGLHGEVLVGSLGFHLKGLDAAFLNEILHVADGFCSDGIQVGLGLNCLGNGSNSEYLDGLADYLIDIQILYCLDIDEAFVAVNVDVLVLSDFSDFFDVGLNAVHKHAFEVGLVHAL